MEIQSGFVLAVLIAALLLVDRIGGGDELVRRLFQVALAATLAFTAISATTAFVRGPEYPTSSSSSSSFDSSSNEETEQREFFQDLADRNSAATSIHFGAGVAWLVFGALLLRRARTIGPALVLGGLLLVLFGGVPAGESGASSASFLNVYASAIASFISQGSQKFDVIRFVVFASGAAGLLLFGFFQWDGTPTQPAVEAPAPSTPSSA